MEEVKVNNTNKKPTKEEIKQENEKELQEIMEAASALAVKSKDPAFNKIIKERANY